MCRSVFSWTAIISSHSSSGHGHEALRLHKCMLQDGVEPNNYTYVALFKACGSMEDVSEGMRFHMEASKKGYTSDVYVGSSLVSMYGKCDATVEAEKAFGNIQNPNVVSWNAMLSVYIENGQGEEALSLYRQMQEENVSFDQLTLVISLRACGIIAICDEKDAKKGQLAMEIGQGLHVDAHRKGYTSLCIVGNTLISMYGKCNALVEAEYAFDRLCHRTLVSWNAMFSTYVDCGHGKRALQLLKKMQEDGIMPDAVTFLICFRACKALLEEESLIKKQTVVAIGQALHKDASRMGYLTNVFVANALLIFYSKCGEIVEAETIFHSLAWHSNIVSWVAMISMYIEQGAGEKALQLYIKMEHQSLDLDEIMLILILRACSLTGDLDGCKKIHFKVVSTGINLMTYMANTLVYAYGSCGSMIDGDEIFHEIPEPSIVFWNSRITGHAAEGDAIESFFIFEELKLVGFEPNDVSFLMLLLVCSYSGLTTEGLGYLGHISKKYGLTPNSKHYGIILDLLGRAGDFKRIEDLLERIPTFSNQIISSGLLNACKMHGNQELAVEIFDHTLCLKSTVGNPYVLMSNICAYDGLYASKKEDLNT